MDDSQCIGCRICFHDGEKLVGNHAVQFKDYSIPFKEDPIKWSVTKSIISFLNAKGGTLFLGVDPATCTVQGLFLERKERDNFKLTLKQLIEKIFPKVDLNDRQQVEVHYIPVFRANSFEGKYVVKIIVQQGDPAQVYLIAEKIKLLDENNNKTDQIELYYAFERLNSGTRELKGFDLMEAVYEKASRPSKVVSFHDSCNPEPPYLQLQIRTLRFTGLNRQQYHSLETAYTSEFQKLNIDFNIIFHEDQQIAQIYIEDREDFQSVKDYIQTNIQYLNLVFDEPTYLSVVGQRQHFFLIKSGKGPKHHRLQQRKEGSRQPPQLQVKTQKKSTVRNVDKPQPRFHPSTTKPPEQPKRERKGQQLAIVFTHIDPSTIQTLQKYLRNSIYRAYQKQFVHYKNTIELHFADRKQMQNYMLELPKRQKQLSAFGFKRQIRYGLCDNKLKICNADWGRSKEMKAELKQMMGEGLLELRSHNNALVCQMGSRELTCAWLDQLLDDRAFKKKYTLRGGQQIPKLKIYLEVSHPAPQ